MTPQGQRSQGSAHHVPANPGSPEGCSQPSSPPLCGGVMTMIDATVAPKVGFISPFGTTACNVNHISASGNALASWRSAVSKPSVNQP